jgi:hypothetical protein
LARGRMVRPSAYHPEQSPPRRLTHHFSTASPQQSCCKNPRPGSPRPDGETVFHLSSIGYEESELRQ